MSSELAKRGAGYLAKNDDNAIRRGIAEVSLTAGGGGLALWLVAGMLPFITLPMILIALVVLGILVYPKGR